MASPTPPPTLLTRILSTIPFVILSATCARIFQINSAIIGPWLDKSVSRGTIEWDGGFFKLFESFYPIPALDEVWRTINAAFTPSTFGYDPVASWQMFSFLADAGVVYAIWVLEASRKGNERTSAYYAANFGQLFQIVGGAIIGPLYYVGYMITAPRAGALTPETRRIEPSHARVLLPTLLAVYYLPYLGAFLASSFEIRHICTWLWQMFPIWIAISQAILSRIFPAPYTPSTLTSSRLTILPLSLFSALTYIYTALSSPYPLTMIFLPITTMSTSPLSALRIMLQVDHLIFFACPIIWLMYLAPDLRSAGLTNFGALNWGAGLVVMSLLVGPGAAIGLGWLVREDFLAKLDGLGEKGK